MKLTYHRASFAVNVSDDLDEWGERASVSGVYPVKTVGLPLSYSDNPGVNDESYRGLCQLETGLLGLR